MKKILITTIFAILLVVTLSSIISAVFWACFEYGQVRNYCEDYRPPETCNVHNGCQLCMSDESSEVENCYVSAPLSSCYYGASGDCSTSSGNGTFEFDLTPPVLTIHSPKAGAVYSSKALILDLATNEEADIYFTDLITGRGRWTPICTSCSSHEKLRSFPEGVNNLQFRATDSVGNKGYKNISFTIDSTNPKILKTEPKSGFTNGEFLIEFKEDNHASLSIKYGNNALGFKTQEVNINNNCQFNENNGKHYCDDHIDLSSYNGNEILYWVNLTDIAGNVGTSRKANVVAVDTTLPAITNLVYPIVGKYANLKFNVAETNFEEATYSYTDTTGKLRDGTLCSRLKAGVCEKRLTFKTGHYNLSIQVTDEAGNSAGQSVSFNIA